VVGGRAPSADNTFVGDGEKMTSTHRANFVSEDKIADTPTQSRLGGDDSDGDFTVAPSQGETKKIFLRHNKNRLAVDVSQLAQCRGVGSFFVGHKVGPVGRGHFFTVADEGPGQGG